MQFILEYRNACLIALTDTYLKEQDLQTYLEIDGFGLPLRVDRDSAVTWKSLRGGQCLYMNNNWFNTAVDRESLWTPDI